MESIKNTWYNPSKGFKGQEAFFKTLRDEGYPVKRKQVSEFLSKQYAYQIHKDTRRPRFYNTIYTSKPFNQFQVDIVIYDRYEWANYKYILTIIDVYSRYAQAVPMTRRTNESIINALEKAFGLMGGTPKTMNADNEFNTSVLNNFFLKKNIEMYFSEVGQINKNAIIERFNRTLAKRVDVWRQSTNKKNWFSVLPEIVQNYNNTYHTTIKATPADVMSEKDYNHQIVRYRKPLFEVGDIVRIKRTRKVFDKGDLHSFSKEVYHVVSVKGNKIFVKNTETMQDYPRSLKAYELQKIDTIIEKHQGEEQEQQQETEEYEARPRRFNRDIQDVLNQPILNNRRLPRPNPRFLNGGLIKAR